MQVWFSESGQLNMICCQDAVGQLPSVMNRKKGQLSLSSFNIQFLYRSIFFQMAQVVPWGFPC